MALSPLLWNLEQPKFKGSNTKMHWPGKNDITATRSCTRVYGFISTFICSVSIKDGRAAYTIHWSYNAGIMTLPQLCHITNVTSFISTSTNPLTTKFSRMVDKHVLTLPSRWWSCYHKYAAVLTFMALFLLL